VLFLLYNQLFRDPESESVNKLLLFLASTIATHGPAGCLIMNNNDVIVGEIKSMDKGVLVIDTDYSDSDF
jgi:hypothetical protein